MAYIEKRQKRDGSVTYRAQVRVKGFPAQAHTFRRKADAVKWARQIEAAIDERRLSAVPAEVRDLTVGQLLEAYIEEGCPRVTATRKVAKPDQRNRIRSLRWWEQRLGDYALAMLQPADVARELAAFRKGGHGNKPISNATSNRYLSALSAVFSWAVRERTYGLERNPLIGAQLRRSEPRERDRVLSAEEQTRLVVAAREDQHPRIELWIVLGLATGARQGDLGKLTWDNVKFYEDGAVLTFFETKNGHPRPVGVPAGDSLDALRAAFQVRMFQSKLVMATPGTTPETKQITFPKLAWDRVRRTAGLEDTYVVFHTLRHTNASVALREGLTLAEVGRELGHRSPQSTQRYAHLVEAHAREIAAKLGPKLSWGS